MNLLKTEIQAKFDERAIQLEAAKAAHQKQQNLCEPLKEPWLSTRPAQTVVTEISS